MFEIRTILKSLSVVAIICQPGLCNIEGVEEASVKVLLQPTNNHSLVSSNHVPYVSTGYPRCGGNYSSPTGGIFYKPFSSVLENERCVWIINADGARGYRLDVQYLGKNINSDETDPAPFLMVSSFSHGGMGSPESKTYLPSSTGKFSIADCNTIVVTFASPPLKNDDLRGFVIQYEALFVGNTTRVSRFSTQRILQSSQLEFTYPSGYYNRYYNDHEFSSFAVVPDNNVYTGEEKTILYKKNRLEGESCYDSLFVYKLNFNGTREMSPWDGMGRICGNISSAGINHDDVVLLIFQTDISVTGYGFTLSFPRSS